ncbi:hypothetical protein ACIGO9_28955 [Nocardia asteroides]|uniref:hypothetical protein n=1 Tax=Nocardia asteroides TaxID=1824 RepID=UPI0037C55F5D
MTIRNPIFDRPTGTLLTCFNAAVVSKSLLVLGSLMFIGVVACAPASPKPNKVANTPVVFPNVLGMSGDAAEDAIEELYLNGAALTESGGPTYEYAKDNHCIWYGPDGRMSNSGLWPVTSVALVLNPSMTAGTSPTEPVHAGAQYGRLDRLFFQLLTEKPDDVWCKPVGEGGSGGGTPDVGAPNNDDGGESWVCRRHRLC